MKEYIERAMAFAVLVDFPGELSPENIGLAVARKAIDALPAADVAEVRHGSASMAKRVKFPLIVMGKLLFVNVRT